jgi:bacillopeptidase F
MRRRWFAAVLFALVAAATVAEPLPQTLSPELRALAAESRFGAEVPVIIRFADALDTRRFQLFATSHERRHQMVRALREQSQDASRSAMISLLHLRGAKGIRPLWLSNSLAATVPAALLPELARSPGIARVRLDAVVQAPGTTYDAATRAEWNLRAMRAPEVWGLGYQGQGVTVAILDSGVDASHPDLSAQYRGGGNSWFDPYGEHATPYDADGHGTQVAGVLLGRNRSGSAIGVAPGAQWIAAKVFDDSGLATLSAIHEALQWLLDPDDDPATNDAPDVVNASWGMPGASACSNEFDRDIEALEAAGIAIVFSAGNDGPAPSTTVSPGNGPETLSVGAVDDTESVALFSGRGPSACDGATDPELVAPGVAVFTAETSRDAGDGAYAIVSGSSFAAPHVAGAMALLRSVRPDLTVAELEAIVRDSARNLGAAGPDNNTGYGLLDAFAAVTTLMGEVPVAVSDAATTAEDTPVTIGVLANDYDPQGQALTLAAVASPSAQGGTVALNAGGTLTYTPAANFSGTDSFTYVASDGRYSGVGRVIVTVTPVNDALDVSPAPSSSPIATGWASSTPVAGVQSVPAPMPGASADTAPARETAEKGEDKPRAENDERQLVANDDNFILDDANDAGQFVVAAPGVLANDHGGETLTVTLAQNVRAGKITLAADGGFTYTPPASGMPEGELSFTYRVNDGASASRKATATIRIRKPLVALPDKLVLSARGGQGEYVLDAPGVLANDTGTDNLRAVLERDVTIGHVTLTPDGGFTYQPPPRGLPKGPLSFTYKISSGALTSRSTTVVFTLDQPLQANADTFVLSTVDDSGRYVLPSPGVLANDTGNGALTAILARNVKAGSVTLAPTGGFTYTPPASGAPAGTLSFSYKVGDGKDMSAEAQATFTLRATSARQAGQAESRARGLPPWKRVPGTTSPAKSLN